MSTTAPSPLGRRMTNPALVIPEAAKAIQELTAATMSGGVPATTMALVHLRVSQINGCSVWVEHGQLGARRQGESEDRLFALSAWRDSPRFDEKERAALALAESVTRMSDRSDPVPDEVWNEAARYHDERQLAALVLWIAISNLYNRLNVTTKQIPGSWGYLLQWSRRGCEEELITPSLIDEPTDRANLDRPVPRRGDLGGDLP